MNGLSVAKAIDINTKLIEDLIEEQAILTDELGYVQHIRKGDVVRRKDILRNLIQARIGEITLRIQTLLKNNDRLRTELSVWSRESD